MSAVTAKAFPRRRGGMYFNPLSKREHVSVTKVCDAAGGEKVQALIRWASYGTADIIYSDPEKFSTQEAAYGALIGRRDTAGARGSMVHSLVEAVAKGSDVDTVPPHVAGYLRAFKSFWSAVNPEVLHTEVNVYSDTHMYAGTCDLISRWQDGLVHMTDFKTGKAIYLEAHIQLSAYKNAEYIITKDLVPVKYPMPKVDSTNVVLLNANGTYSLSKTDAPLSVFLGLKHYYEWAKEAS